MSAGLVWVVCKLCSTKRPVEKMAVYVEMVNETTLIQDAGVPKVEKSWTCVDGVWCAGQAAKKGKVPA